MNGCMSVLLENISIRNHNYNADGTTYFSRIWNNIKLHRNEKKLDIFLGKFFFFKFP